MDKIDHQTTRLLKAASDAPPPLPEAVPFGLEARILASWRRVRQPDSSVFLAALFHRAVICACALMVFSVLLNYRANENETGDELAIANYEMRMSLMP